MPHHNKKKKNKNKFPQLKARNMILSIYCLIYIYLSKNVFENFFTLIRFLIYSYVILNIPPLI